MNPNRTALLAIVVTGVAAALFAAFTATPEVITQVIVGIEAVAASALVVFILLRIPRMRTLPEARQRKFIWLSAGTTSAVVCLLPLARAMFRR
jgi:hypothetical protein